MSYHITHFERSILCEPEFDYFETEYLDDFINEILTEFTDVRHVILYLGTLDIMDEEDLNQLFFLNDELMVKKGNLHIVSLSTSIRDMLDDKIPYYDEIDEAVDEIDGLILDTDIAEDQ